MKNRFLVALLTLATVPFFTSSFAESFGGQAVNTELAKWKEVKANLETALTQIASELTNMDELQGQFYNEIEKLYNLIPDNTVGNANTNKYIPDNALGNIDKVFDILCVACSQTDPRQEIEYFSPEEYVGFNAFYNFLKDEFVENNKQEIESILTQIDSILIKYDTHNEQCLNKNASVLERESAPEKAFKNAICILPAIEAEIAAGKQSQDKNIEVLTAKLSFCIFILGPTVAMLVAAQKTWPILLQKIDAKIAQLEMQQ